jgi:hypothetical protein
MCFMLSLYYLDVYGMGTSKYFFQMNSLITLSSQFKFCQNIQTTAKLGRRRKSLGSAGENFIFGFSGRTIRSKFCSFTAYFGLKKHSPFSLV